MTAGKAVRPRKGVRADQAVGQDAMASEQTMQAGGVDDFTVLIIYPAQALFHFQGSGGIIAAHGIFFGQIGKNQAFPGIRPTDNNDFHNVFFRSHHIQKISGDVLGRYRRKWVMVIGGLLPGLEKAAAGFLLFLHYLNNRVVSHNYSLRPAGKL